MACERNELECASENVRMDECRMDKKRTEWLPGMSLKRKSMWGEIEYPRGHPG